MRFEISFKGHDQKARAESLGVDMCCGWSFDKKVIDSDEKARLDIGGVLYMVHATHPDSSLEIERSPLKGDAVTPGKLAPGLNFDGSLKGNYSHSEMLSKLSELYEMYGPGSSPKSVISGMWVQGRSHLNNPIYVMQLGTPGKPAAFLSGCTHAREPLSMMSVLNFVFWICENYLPSGDTTPKEGYRNNDSPFEDFPTGLSISQHSIAKSLVENFCIFVMPMCNPDGYIFNEQLEPGGSGMYRKNRNVTDTWYCPKQDQGVDVNRNYGISWGKHPTGSSKHPCNQFYRGRHPFSEKESQVKRDFFGHKNNVLTNDKNIRIALHNHSYGGFIKIPGGMPKNSPHYALYRMQGKEMARHNGYRVGDALETAGYITDGSEEVWTNNNTEGNFVHSFMPEIGYVSDGFWPPRHRLRPIVDSTLWMFQSAVGMCADFPVITEISLLTGEVRAGALSRFGMTFMNTGLEECDINGVAISFVVSSSEGQQVLGATKFIEGVAGLKPGGYGTVDSVDLFVPTTIEPGSTIQVVSFSHAGFPIFQQPKESFLVVGSGSGSGLGLGM